MRSSYQTYTITLFVAGVTGIVSSLADMAQGRFFDVIAVVAFWIAAVLAALVCVGGLTLLLGTIDGLLRERPQEDLGYLGPSDED